MWRAIEDRGREQITGNRGDLDARVIIFATLRSPAAFGELIVNPLAHRTEEHRHKCRSGNDDRDVGRLELNHQKETDEVRKRIHAMRRARRLSCMVRDFSGVQKTTKKKARTWLAGIGS